MRIKTIFEGVETALTENEIKNLQFLVKKFHINFAIDLGTYKGGSALIFQKTGVKKIYTFDHVSRVENPHSEINYNIGHIFKNKHLNYDIKYLCSFEEQKILFCDNGNKKKEINTFAPRLRTNDILCAHDFKTEFTLKDIPIVQEKFKRIKLPFKNTLIIAWIKL
jgi:cephalosporin hydroxylase